MTNKKTGKLAKQIGFYKKHNLKISRQLRDIIHGYIMSDGYVRPEGNITVDQSAKQEKFAMWLYEKFKDLRTNYPMGKVTRMDKRTNTKTYSVRFNTINLLHGFHHMWYKKQCQLFATEPNYIKRLPKGIACFFSPEFLSVWFAGDGTKTLGSRGAKFEVTNFSPGEREKLIKLFKTKYNISASINRAGKSKSGTEQWTINIGSKEYNKFRSLITQIDLIPTLFPDKLHSAN